MPISDSVTPITSWFNRQWAAGVRLLPRCATTGLAAVFFFFFAALLIRPTCTAQTARTSASPEQLALIARAAEREQHELESPSPFQYQERLEWIWGTETRSVIETAEGRADRIVYFGDEPLSPEQSAKQQRRLEKLLTDRNAVKSEMEDQKPELQRRIRMIKAFPKAVLFDYAGRENGLLRFTFRPNPDFSPKDRETQMYRGMEGFVLVEPVQERLVRVEGKLVKDVSFGWGIFGRLYKGGTYEIAQTQLSPGAWRITTMNVDVRGRVFFFDTFRFLRNESNTRFRPVPATMTYHAAVKTLLEAPRIPDKDRPAGPSAAGRSRAGHRIEQ
jgi:hypothetical protein